MKTTVYNQRQLDSVVSDIIREFEEKKALNVSYEKPSKPKTLKQLGYIFGVLVDSCMSYWNMVGNNYSVMGIKYLFYEMCSPRSSLPFFNRERPLTLSEMTVEQASEFINNVINLIDFDEHFEGIILPPSARYTWINHLEAETIRAVEQAELPERCPEYLSAERKQACIWCGRTNCGVQVHHLKQAGITGTSLKAPDWFSIPLCENCHIRQLHQHGQNAFLEDLSWITKKISIEDFCKIKFLRWYNKV